MLSETPILMDLEKKNERGPANLTTWRPWHSLTSTLAGEPRAGEKLMTIKRLLM